MSEWQRHSVTELERAGVLLVQDGNHGNDRPRSHEFVSEGVAFVRAANMTSGRVDFRSASRINDVARNRIRKGVGRPGDVLLSHKGTVGRVAAVPLDAPEFVCSPQTTFWRSLDESRLDRTYLRCFMSSPDFVVQLDSRKGETDMAPYVSLTEQRKLTVVLPPIAEQRAIAGVLGALDDKIESNRRILDTAKRLITAEYQYVVSSVDDEPYGVRLDVQMGAPFKGEYFSEIGYGRPLIRIRDLKTFSSQVWSTESRADEIGIVPGDILVGMDAEFRSTIWLGDAGVLNQRMCRFVPRKGVSRSFAWMAIQPELEYCERAKSGTTVIHLNKGDIDRFRVPRLSDEQHEELSMVTEPIFDRLVVAGREISSLSGLRDALLPELLSGRLRVRDAERVVGGAV